MSRSGKSERLTADEESPARLAVDLPSRIHRLLKARAAAEGITIREYILELLRRDGIA